MLSTVRLRHGKIDLALHQLREADGPVLLLLHGLGERTPTTVPVIAHVWPGPVWGLDFTGHGESTVPRGGGYSAEALMSDADAVLAHLGPLTMLGRGLGGYVGLLLVGSRPEEIRGVVITDGPGLDGGGSEPQSASILDIVLNEVSSQAPDPWALLELSSDVRPTDYVAQHVGQIGAFSSRGAAVFVDAIGRPAWLRVALEHDEVVEMAAVDALTALGRATR